MTDAWWRRALHLCSVRLFFDRVRVCGLENRPCRGPVLFLGLHRNGAVDGFVYHSVLPGIRFLIARRLRKNPLGRLFFSGIEVDREKDREGAAAATDTAADGLRACIDHLAHGGSLFVFPEGTSSLGPRHLPLKSGAARIWAGALKLGLPVTVVPVGIHYEHAWAFRSRVEVVIAPALEPPAGVDPHRAVGELKRLVQEGIEAVGINVASDADLAEVEALAQTAGLGTGRGYFAGLKTLEGGVPPSVHDAWLALDEETRALHLARFQNIPLFPTRSAWLYAVALVGALSAAAPGFALNLPPLAAAAWAGRTFPDGPNVVALWKILVGVPAFVLWQTALVSACVGLGRPAWALIVVGASAATLLLVRRVKKLSVAVWNAVRHADLGPRLLALHQLILREVPDAAA